MARPYEPHHVYRYNRAAVVLCVAVTLAFAWLVPYLLFLSVRHEDLLNMAVAVLVGVLPVAGFGAVLSRASLAVDEVGISASTFGVRTRALRWGEVKRIKKLRLPNGIPVKGYGYSDQFHIQDGRKHSPLCRLLVNVCGNIVFTQDIHDLRRLLDQINVYARQYNIPLVVQDSEANAAGLASDPQFGYWRRAASRVPEVTVDEF
jgi:hypothetical protein